MYKLLTAALAVLFLAVGAPILSAQTEELGYDHRVTGDRSIAINLGGIFPEAYEEFDPLGNFHNPNLTTGVTLGINLNFYGSENWTIGGAVDFMTASGPNTYMLFLVPLTVQTGWEFTFNHFTFPVGMGLGFSFSTYRSMTNFDPLLLPYVGAYWNMNSSWSFGIKAKEWIIFQPYLPGGTVPWQDSRIAYFTDTTIGFIYHF